MSDIRTDWGIHSPEWAYNQPGFEPRCSRCKKRKDDCKKFNSEELGMFAGDWICPSCVRPDDTLTPAQKVCERT